MSILLDAVTRAKQQEAHIDPVLTPQTDIYSKKELNPLIKSLTILVMLILLSVCLAWLTSHFLFNEQSQHSINQISQVNQSQDPADASSIHVSSKIGDEVDSASIGMNQNKQHQLVSDEPVTKVPLGEDVQFVGKVALPVPQALPNTQLRANETAEPQMWVSDRTGRITKVDTLGSEKNDLTANQAITAYQSEKAPQMALVSASKPKTDAEPIILGAQMNQKGQDVLAALKKEVAIAASEVGMKQKTVAKAVKKESVTSLASETAADKDNALLIAALQKALRQVERDHAQQEEGTPQSESTTDPKSIPKYGQLPASVQLQVPEFSINGHVYASSVEKRWLNVDGVELQQGDTIKGKLKVIEIRPQDVVLEISGNQFSVPAA